MHCLIKAYFKNICKLASNGSYVPVNLLNDEGSNEGNIDVGGVRGFRSPHDSTRLGEVAVSWTRPHNWVLFKDISLVDGICIRDVVSVNPLMVARTIPKFYK